MTKLAFTEWISTSSQTQLSLKNITAKWCCQQNGMMNEIRVCLYATSYLTVGYAYGRNKNLVCVWLKWYIDVKAILTQHWSHWHVKCASVWQWCFSPILQPLRDEQKKDINHKGCGRRRGGQISPDSTRIINFISQ